MRAGSSSACDWRQWGCRGVREAAEKEHEGLKQAVRERMRALRADLEAVDSDGEEEPWARRPIADRCRHFPPGTSHSFSLCTACLHLPACPHSFAMHHQIWPAEDAICLSFVVHNTFTFALASFRSLHFQRTSIKAGAPCQYGLLN